MMVRGVEDHDVHEKAKLPITMGIYRYYQSLATTRNKQRRSLQKLKEGVFDYPGVQREQFLPVTACYAGPITTKARRTPFHASNEQQRTRNRAPDGSIVCVIGLELRSHL